MAAVQTYKKHNVVLYNELRSRINSSCPKADVKGILEPLRLGLLCDFHW